MSSKAAVAIVVIGFEDSDMAEASKAFKKSGLPGAVVLDVDRSAFGSFQVKAYPTAHVYDRTHQEIAVSRGYGPHFVFRVHLAARYGAGQIDQQQYEKLLAGGTENRLDPELVKLHRKAGLARKLALGGKPDQGLALLEQALADAPDVAPDAMVFELAIRLNLLNAQQARASELLAAFKVHFPDSPALPFMECRTALGAGDLERASAAIKGKRARLEPEAVLLRGLILEAQERCQEAADLYREELEKQALTAE